VKLLVATRNAGKQREIRAILGGLGVEVVFPDDAGLWAKPEEATLEDTGTYEGNARRKAEYFARRSSLPTVADDSGIEVLTLGGKPGVLSARFAMAAEHQDEANNAELLRRLAGAPPAKRRARYRCVAVYLRTANAMPEMFEGTCDGSIAEAPRGTRGFGYDPLFLSDELHMTFGEAPEAEKHAVSHRGRAFRAFAAWLAAHPVA
jgi:XTP/dITP diphosphohydrolase